MRVEQRNRESNGRRTYWWLLIVLILLLILIWQVVPAPVQHGGEGDAETDTPMTTPSGQARTGKEAFLSIGGISGAPARDQAVLAVLQAGYQAAGFRVHFVIAPRTGDVIAAKMVEVAAEYTLNDVNLQFAAFHHTGHGFFDHITFEWLEPPRMYETMDHTEVVEALARAFPASQSEFADTRFSTVYDACGQGRATEHPVAGREGVIATASPNATNCCATSCTKCEPTFTAAYEYSTAFGPALGNSSAADDFARIEEAHNVGKQRLVAVKAQCAGKGKFRRYP